MSSGNAVKAIIFDLGNVLVDFDHRIAAAKITRHCHKSATEIYQLFFDSGITRRFEEGVISKEDFFTEIRSMLGLDLDFSGFLPIWNEIFFLSVKNRQVLALAQKLKDRYQTVVLSNINILHYEYLKNALPVFGPFHKVFTSCEMGFVKPDHRIYAGVLAEMRIDPEQAFYTDDRAELVESARSLGIKSAVFSGVEQLKNDLVNSGININ